MNKPIWIILVICILAACCVLFLFIKKKTSEKGNVDNNETQQSSKKLNTNGTFSDCFGSFYQYSNAENKWLPNTLLIPFSIGRSGCYLASPTRDFQGCFNGTHLYLNNDNGQGADRIIPNVYRLFFKGDRLLLSIQYESEDDGLFYSASGQPIPPILVKQSDDAPSQSVMEVELKDALRICVCGVWLCFQQAKD